MTEYKIYDKEKLKKIVDYAYQYVPYYKAKINPKQYEAFVKSGDIELLPILSRRDVVDNYPLMFSERSHSVDLLWESTSGTSGIPLKIGKTLKERSKMAIRLMKWRKNNFGVGLADNYAYFVTIDMNTKYTIHKNVFCFSEIHLDDNSLCQYYNIIVENEIKWIYCTPSVINVFKDYMRRKKLPRIFSLKYIELTGEYISTDEKQNLMNFFKCKVAVQYGITEVWSVAQECKAGNLHLMEEDIALEFGHGEILVTSLESFTMPFIRYKVDDELCCGEICDCGSKFHTINILRSRTQEYLYLGTEVKLSPILLRISINDLISKRGEIGIRQYQFVQYNFNSLVCSIEYSNDLWLEEDISSLLYETINHLYQLPIFFSIKVERVFDFRDRITRGKLGYFLSNIGKGN